MTTDLLSSAGPATHLPLPASGRWTLADYERLPADGLRYELISGALHMAPAPSTDHQASNGLIFFYLMQQIQFAQRGQVFSAPIDVELGPDTVVQPDIVVILNGSTAQITPRRIIGPPDLVVEIVSPSTASYDRREKRDLYAAAGIREYWLADPASRTVELLTLDGDSYRATHIYEGRAVLPSAVIAGWDVATGQLFG